MDVILVPGIWMPGAVMWPIALWLRRMGFAPRIFTYRSRRPPQENIERLAGYALAKCGGRPCGFVGLSMGARVVLDMLNERPDVPLAAAVLIGPPARGSLSARRLAKYRVGRAMLGASIALWEDREARWRRGEPLGVIAGTAPWGLGRLFGAMPGANDGVVLLEETSVEGASAHVPVPLAHSAMAVSPRVARLVVDFLRHGRFAVAVQRDSA